MKFLLSYILFEKTSLLEIGVPFSVMKSVQKNYAISDDAQWKNLKYKKDVVSALHKKKNTLIISISAGKLLILFSYNREYYLETYLLTEKDDFGNEQWQRIDRIQSTLTDILKKVERGFRSYELISGNWLHEYSGTRRMKKETKSFEEITNNFKKEFAENFTNIAKRMYGKKANVITDIIISHLKNVKNNLSDEKIREILYLNVDRAKEIDTLKKKVKTKDPYKLYSEIVREDSLTIFNEYLIKFETEYSDKYKEYLNIPVMIERWSREKIMTAFMYYLWSSNLMSL